MQKFDFAAPANGAPQTINVPGRYLKYVTGNAGGNDAGLIVTPGSKPGSKVLLYPGQAITLPNDGTAGPNAWTIANAVGAGAITGTIVIGNGRIDDNTLQGVVQVVDGGKSRTLSGSAFGMVASQLAVAGQYGRVQLWNAANSGIRCVVESVQVVNGNAAMIGAYLQFNAAALATAIGAGQSKKSGGAASMAVCYADSTASVPSGGESSLIAVSGSTYQIKFAEPLIVTPGYGLVVYGGSVNETLQANFEWYEEPNV
ncbi:MAG: hypothetical protein IH603_11140 [Burkholderia vietnamiensis]|nr:hypothetical protein [Burkholderia vietnamiensis]